VTDAWERDLLNAETEEGNICPIYRKGERLRCETYGGITLLNVVCKIFSKTLKDRPKIEAILRKYQTGFQEGKATTDQIHTLRQIMETMN
jgi:hypothetical protein